MDPPTNLRYALVTGAASGLGRAFCLELARGGWHVAVIDSHRERAQETLADVVEHGGRGQVHHLDVAELPAWQSLVEKLRSQWPRLDLLVNSAGICGAGAMGEYSWDDFRRILDVNLVGAVHGCHVCVPWLRETAPGGHIVNVASLAAVLSAPTMAAYNISKAGIVSLSETLYNEFYDVGIGVTVVMPGFFASRLLESGRFNDELLRKVADKYTVNAEFTAEDVVAHTLRAIKRRRLYVILGRRSRVASRLKRLAPTWFLRVVSRTFTRDLKRAKNAVEQKT